MSLEIIKSGLQDTIQDGRRKGHQHLGVNPSGPMDSFASKLANALLGKALHAPTLELHFPASQICFRKQTIICITGADFSPAINDRVIPLNHPVVVEKNSVLQFKKMIWGKRTYIAFLPSLHIDMWLNSYSTNLKANAGGWKGRCLQKGDCIPYQFEVDFSQLLKRRDFVILPWTAPGIESSSFFIECIVGSEWNWLTTESKHDFQEGYFQITNETDRMGYRMSGRELVITNKETIISSGVAFGTIQLLPQGEMIALMADHQTTGGYPRIANVISAHLPLLAQKGTNDVLRFKIVDLKTAERKFIEQEKYLHYLKDAGAFKIENILHDTM